MKTSNTSKRLAAAQYDERVMALRYENRPSAKNLRNLRRAENKVARIIKEEAK